MDDKQYLKLAVEQARKSIEAGGFPAGAVVVKDGKIFAKGVSLGFKLNDPTSHAETASIRETCKILQTTDLSGATLYASLQPCLMCFSVANWAGISKVTNPQAKAFLEQFLSDREINKEFYKRVPEEKFDFRMVDTPQRKSDSPRESLAHQIDTTRDYINGVKTGTLQFGVKYEDLAEPQKLTKDELLAKLEESEKELIEILSDSEIGNKKVQVPWSKEPIPAVSSFWALDSHEILHQGWNLAIMDHLNIERFPALKEMWG